VPNLNTEVSGKDFAYVLLLALGVIAALSVAIFSFVATVQLGEALAVVLFLAVGGLLIAGYMVGLIVLGLAIVPLVQYVRRLRDRRLVTESAQA
jgi:uncharacterized membrane protein YhaH (DUF805 family)